MSIPAIEPTTSHQVPNAVRADPITRRRALALVSAMLLAACGRSEDTPATVRTPAVSPVAAAVDQSASAPWCLVARRQDLASGMPTPVRHSIPELSVSHRAVATTKNVYDDTIGDESEIEDTIGVDSLPDGTVLVYVPGTGDEWESTALLLQLRIDVDACELLSCHLYWQADVPPYSEWCRIDGGSIAIDCPTQGNQWQLGVAFDLKGSRSVSGSFHVGTLPRTGRIPAAFSAEIWEAVRH